MGGEGEGISLDRAQIEALAAGHSAPEVLEVLREGQHSRFLLTLASIVDTAPGEVTVEALALIDRAQELDEDACFEVFTYPHLGTWAWVCLEQLIGVSGTASKHSHLSYLSVIAATAAVRCGVPEFEVSVPVWRGGVVLPSLGRFVVGADDLDGEATLRRSADGRLEMAIGGRRVQAPLDLAEPTAEWQPARRIALDYDGIAAEVVLDDLDPYRRHYMSSDWYPPTGRLSDEEFEVWRSAIVEAWAMLVDHHRSYAVELAVGLQAVVPMVDEVVARHGRPKHAFGSVAMANVGARWLAFALLDEFQRSKLANFDYLFPLHNATHDEESYLWVWSQRPSSFREYFENVYALSAAVEFWATQSRIADDLHERAVAATLAMRRCAQFSAARNELLASGELTEFGRSFLGLVPAPELDVSDDLARLLADLVRTCELDHTVSWRLWNLRPDGDVLGLLADDWMASKPCPLERGPATRGVGGASSFGWLGRRWLLVARAVTPQRLEGLRDDPDALRLVSPYATVADVDFVEGDVERAVAEYCASIVERPDDLASWSGLAVSYAERDLAALSLRRAPELVVGLYRVIAARYGVRPDPLDLATWVAPLAMQPEATRFQPVDLAASP